MTRLTHEQKVEIAKNRAADEQAVKDDKALTYPVKKSNEMIQRSRYSLTLTEQRLLLYLISRIQKSDKGQKRYKVKIRDACKVCGIEAKNYDGRTYKAVYDAFSALRDKGFTVYPESGGRTRCAWIERPHQDEKGNMEFNFDPEIVPYLFDVQKRFTMYQLENVVRMRSTYGIRLYELLKSYENIRHVKIELPKLRGLLDAETKAYDKYSFFKMRVLEPALKDISFTDLKVDYLEHKTGRKVTEIEFIIDPVSGAEYYERKGMEFDD